MVGVLKLFIFLIIISMIQSGFVSGVRVLTYELSDFFPNLPTGYARVSLRILRIRLIHEIFVLVHNAEMTLLLNFIQFL